MKHVTYSDKSLLVGDEIADLLMEYATLLGGMGRTDSVTIHAIGSDGNEVDATFLLNPSTILMVESASTDASEPDNGLAVQHLTQQMRELRRPFDLPPEAELPELGRGESAS